MKKVAKGGAITINSFLNEDDKVAARNYMLKTASSNMREAANNGDIETFHKHLGPNFTREEAETHMKRFQQGIQNGLIPLKR